MAEVFDQLTRPIPDGELRGEAVDRSTPRYVEADGERRCALFQERRYTDFLPIVLPTEERVEQMLTGTSRADEMVGKLRPTIGMVALRRRESRRQRRDGRRRARALPGHPRARPRVATPGMSNMSSMGNMVVVNGPIRQEIGMNSGVGALGPYNYANSAIGRAFGLLSQNLQGGSRAWRDVRRLAGLQLLLQLHHVRGERGGEPLGAVPPAVRLRQGRERRHGLVHLGTSGPNTCAPIGRRSSRR